MTKPTTIPQHIAIIMDGNRRWAREQGLPVFAGHEKVANQVLEPLIEHASTLGVKYLTFWAWSTENWQRDQKEVGAIMRIFKHVIQRQWDRLHKKGVRIKTIGDITKFEKGIRDSLEKVIEQTKNNTKITAVFALNYGGRNEIIRAISRLLENFQFPISNFQVTDELFEKYLDTSGIPDPDIIVRTGGEQRMSGFLPWQSVYSEYFFAPWYMPDFTPKRLDEVIEELHNRHRRFGK